MTRRGLAGRAAALAALLVCLLAGPASAGGRPGTASGQFLTLGTGARPGAMGGAYAAVADGVHAVAWNPAGLGRLKRAELQFVHTEWVADIAYDYLAYAHGRPVLGGYVGGSVTYLDYGKINVTRIAGQAPVTGLGTAEANDLAVALAWGAPGSVADYGFAVKYVEEELEAENARAVAVDAGVLFDVTPRLTLGATVANLGTKLKFDREAFPLPLTGRLGAAWRTRDGNWLLAGDLIVPTDGPIRLGAGAEYRLMQWFFLRGGYQTQNDAGPGWTAGFGCAVRDGIEVDYAFVPYGDLGRTHRVSLNWEFGPPVVPPVEVPVPQVYPDRAPAGVYQPPAPAPAYPPAPAYYPPAPAYYPPAPAPVSAPAPAVYAPPAPTYYPPAPAPPVERTNQPAAPAVPAYQPSYQPVVTAPPPAEESVYLPVPIYIPPLPDGY